MVFYKFEKKELSVKLFYISDSHIFDNLKGFSEKKRRNHRIIESRS